MMRKIAAVAAIAAVGLLGAGSQAALAGTAPAPGAGTSASQERAWVAQQVRGLLKYNPGAVQISANAVRYKGAILGVTIPGQSSVTRRSASGVCPGNWVCLFIDVRFNMGDLVPRANDWIDFYNCGVNYNLFNYRIPTGGATWANQASSIDYPGSAINHEAKFNHNGNWWLYLYRDHYLKDLTLDGGPNPNGNSNDWITGLYAC